MNAVTLSRSVLLVMVSVAQLALTASAAPAGQPTRDVFRIPHTDYDVLLGATASAPKDMRPLLAAVATWVAREFSMSDGQGTPLVELTPSTTITALRYERLPPSADREPAVEAPLLVRPVGDTVAIYIDLTQTIHLPDSWDEGSAADLSILVHEMVHHFQNVLHLKPECPQEREKLAYQAQERWLGLFGKSLESEFGLDGFSLLGKTRCFY